MVMAMELVLPVLSATFIATALGVALFAWLRPIAYADTAHVTCWDLSGALCFLGCGAAIFGEAEAVVPLMEELRLRK
jgi:hypothetical protein